MVTQVAGWVSSTAQYRCRGDGGKFAAVGRRRGMDGRRLLVYFVARPEGRGFDQEVYRGP